jgi:hypothetical protein
MRKKMVVVEDKEKITNLTKDVKYEEVFIKNSPYYNNLEKLIACAYDYDKIKYKCNGKNCQTKNSSQRDLIIHTKNGKKADLRLDNIELFCPNCYYDLQGNLIFKKIIESRKIKCKYCDYENVHLLSDFYQKEKICKVCYQNFSANKKKTTNLSLLLLEDDNEINTETLKEDLLNYQNTNLFSMDDDCEYKQSYKPKSSNYTREKLKKQENKLSLELDIDFDKVMSEINAIN